MKFDELDVGAPQRPNRTVTIQMLTPNLNTFNSGNRARDRTTGMFDDVLSPITSKRNEISLTFRARLESLTEILERFALNF